MATINFNGLISPSLIMAFQSIKVPGAHKSADENYAYAVENEAIFQFRLEVETPGGIVAIERHATAKSPLYDKTRPAFICDPTPAASLEKLVDALKANPSAKATLKSVKVWLKPFFLEILKMMTRTAGDTFTVGRPDTASEAAILASFNHQFKGDEGKVSHPKDVQKEIKEIPCDLVTVTVIPASNPADPPRVSLGLNMRVRERLSPADRDDVTRILIAADYTKVYKFSKTSGRSAWYFTPGTAPTGIEKEMMQWEKNVAHFLWNHTSLDRGAKVLKEIVDAGTVAAVAGKSALEVVKIVRDAIDARLITANHWGQRREDRVTETYQRKLSDVFGAIHQSQWFTSSPVSWKRQLSGGPTQAALLSLSAAVQLTLEEQVALSLQWGAGHCGEHSHTSFVAMKQIMDAGHTAKFDTIVLSGNANIDHAFVVGGFKVPTVAKTKLTKAFFDGAKGAEILVFDLRDALTKAGNVDGFVLDPYLAPSEIPRTCKALLAKLNDKAHAARRIADKTTADIRTDFLSFRGNHPNPPVPTLVVSLGLKGL